MQSTYPIEKFKAARGMWSKNIHEIHMIWSYKDNSRDACFIERHGHKTLCFIEDMQIFDDKSVY